MRIIIPASVRMQGLGGIPRYKNLIYVSFEVLGKHKRYEGCNSYEEIPGNQRNQDVLNVKGKGIENVYFVVL